LASWFLVCIGIQSWLWDEHWAEKLNPIETNADQQHAVKTVALFFLKIASAVETLHRKNFRCDKNYTGVMVMFDFFLESC
jgi:hypothetical protein